ncbi:hypothetical protein [Kordiimonas sp.]|uniref:hypothetical protein n=1 Tax=Kordiimonas sp. TaxID=1970157 RepID=UPI003B51D5A2
MRLNECDRAMLRAGLEGVRLHDLRHTVALKKAQDIVNKLNQSTKPALKVVG